MIPSHYPASTLINRLLQDQRGGLLLAVHPCGVDYDPGDLPPWINLLRVYAKLPQSQWHPAMTQLAADAKSDSDADFVEDWFEGNSAGQRALALARRLLPDSFAPEPLASNQEATAALAAPDADALTLWLLQRELGLRAEAELPLRLLESRSLSLQVLLVGNEGLPCKLDLDVVELPLNFACLHGTLVRAPGAALLELGSDFEAGLVQVQSLLRKLLAPAAGASEQVASPPLAIAWSLRTLDKIDGIGNNVTPLLSEVTGPSLTVACAVGCLHLLRDHLAEPWRAKWHKVLRELDMKRFCATAALQGYESSAPHMPESLGADPLQWPLAVVGKAMLKLDAMGRSRPNWPDATNRTVFVAEHQDVSGNVVAWKKCATLAQLILAAHEMSEPLRMPDDFEALHTLLTATDEAPLVPHALLDAVHRTPLPKWLKAGEVPSDVDAEKVLRMWWLKRYAYWASGRHQAFGPLRDGGKDEPVALTERFHPIAIDPEPIRDSASWQERAREQPRQEGNKWQAETLRAYTLSELFEKCSSDIAFRLHAAPASGKTTLLAHHEMHTAIYALRRFQGIGKWGEIAVWLPMRDYPTSRAIDSESAMNAVWGRVRATYPDLELVLVAWRDRKLKLPGLRLRLLCDAINEMPAENDDQRRRVQACLFRGIMEQVEANEWLPPVFTVRSNSQNRSLDGARGCQLLPWDALSRRRYMEKRLGPRSEAFRALQAAIDTDLREDRSKFFATPGHLAAQCTLMNAGIVSEPAKNRAQLFCTLLWLRLAQEQQKAHLQTSLLSSDEQRKIDQLQRVLDDPNGWRWTDRMGPLMHALSAMALWQQHLDPNSRAVQTSIGNSERVWSLSSSRDWLLHPPHLKSKILASGSDEDLLINAAQNLNLLQFDPTTYLVTWTHQLWLELFAALGLEIDDLGGAWLDAVSPVLPSMDSVWTETLGRVTHIQIPKVPQIIDEEPLRYLIQLRGDVVGVVNRVLAQGNSPLAARLALENWSAFGESPYPLDPLGPWRPERQDASKPGTHPLLNRLRSALHERTYSEDVHISQRIEAGDLLGQLGGSPDFKICGEALLLRDEYWMDIGVPGETYQFEMGSFCGGADELNARGELQSVGLPAFRLASFLVTNAQLWCFLKSKERDKSCFWPGPAGLWRERERDFLSLPEFYGAYGENGYGLSPATVNFWQAQAYMLWERSERQKAGMPQLVGIPTEAQWEGAARWHWACQSKDGDAKLNNRWRFAHTAGWDLSGIKPWDFNHHDVTRYRHSPVGVFLSSNVWRGSTFVSDFAGNVWEWCASAHGMDHGYRHTYLDAATQCLAEGSESRALRGGCSGVSANFCRVSYRNFCAPHILHHSFGFRMVMDGAPQESPALN